MSARRVAIDVLARVDDGAYANLVLPARLRRESLDARDRAFVTELVYGTLRNRRLVDSLVTAHLNRPLESLDAPVRAALRVGAYQLLEGVAPHAAVGETVAAVGTKAGGLVNAVLRKVAAARPSYPEGDDVDSVALRTSTPDWMARVLVRDLGARDACAVMEANSKRPVLTLRVRPGVDPDAVAAELSAAGARVEAGRLVASARRVHGGGDPAALGCVRDGRATPQDEASQAVVDVVDPKPGQRIADLAAAPGGKATAMAERGAWVAALDVDPGRARATARAVARLGLERVGVVVGDAAAAPFAALFDTVLLDAPCSGLGVLRRRPDARWRITERDVGELSLLQRRLADAAADLVAPGGRLVYSVCTITEVETRAVDDWLARHRPELAAEPPPGAPWEALGRGARLLPGAAGTDGMYVLSLARPGPTRTA